MEKFKYYLWIVAVFVACVGVDTSTIVVPSAYVGPIIIEYNVESANVSDDYLVVPPDGFIQVPYEDKFGSFDRVQFYFDSIDDQRQISRYYDFEKIPKEAKVVYGGQSRVKLDGVNGLGKVTKFTTYCVGYKEDIQTCYARLDSLLSAQ